MKISYNWLKNYIDLDLEPEELSDILTGLGLEVSGVEHWESIRGGLEGLLVGEVIECIKHPNADRLKLTRVTIGGDPLQIICGAPNVEVGQKVIVATPGTHLYPFDGEPFTIQKGKIRGEWSEGMICSEDEIGLGQDHTGIVVLPDSATIGEDVSNLFDVDRDVVFEIDLTPNRADAMSHLGVARDLAAFLAVNHGHSGKVRLPTPFEFKVQNADLKVDIKIENLEACPRYSGISISNVSVAESPSWLKNRLRAIGVRPINNIVDITNFVLHEMGQPLHAFDINHIRDRKILVKTLGENSPFITLDEVERKLSSEDLMICDGQGKGMCIAGVFGGIESGISERTSNVFLESAHFNAKWIRRTSMRHILRTDAATRFEKGVDPNITVAALLRATELITQIAGGIIASELVDVYPREIRRKEVELRHSRVELMIGCQIPMPELKQILNALDMNILAERPDLFLIDIPTDKPDVVREIDVIEEILRIYDYDRVPLTDKMRISMTKSAEIDSQFLRDQVAILLNGMGLSEMMAMSLTQSGYFHSHPEFRNKLVPVVNTSNVHLDVMRPTLLITGLETIRHNQNRQNIDLKLFEFGKSYVRSAGAYQEEDILALYICGARFKPNWLTDPEDETDFFTLKGIVSQLMERTGKKSLMVYGESTLSDLSYGLEISVDGSVLGNLGQVNDDWIGQFDLRTPVYYCEINWKLYSELVSHSDLPIRELSRFPTIKRDIAIILDSDIKYREVEGLIKKAGGSGLKGISLFDIYQNDEVLGVGKKSYAIRMIFEDFEKTLQDKDVDKVVRKIIGTLESEYSVKLRGQG